MNRLRGQISGVESNGHVSLVDVAVAGNTFACILLEAPDSAPYLAVGNQVNVLFKETEVSLAKSLSGMISLRNRIPGIVRHIRKGQILSEVVLDCDAYQVTSIITSRSITRLDIKVGDEVEALIKANEVMLTEA